jgi:hypothetical protein
MHQLSMIEARHNREDTTIGEIMDEIETLEAHAGLYATLKRWLVRHYQDWTCRFRG